MKISVITLLNVRNYGSVLQTYATQNILQEMGYEVEFVDYLREGQKEKELTKKHLAEIPNKQILRKLYNMFFNIPRTNKRVRKVFRAFLAENINITTRQYRNVDQLLGDKPVADIYCTGSDQMWNSGWNNGIERSFFLDFIQDKPKIAFSTSIGKTYFGKDEEKEITKFLKQYDFITVREKSAKDLLNQHGIRAELVLDPTLMVTAEFWKTFARNSRFNSSIEKYILVYQLHDNHATVDFSKYVKRVAEKLKLPVKVLAYGVPRKKIYDEYLFLPSMVDYVGLFENAEYVITDSFHGTSFCINLEKQFTCIYPDKYSTRLQNILELCSLTEQVLQSNEDMLIDNVIAYDVVSDKLNKLRVSSIETIKSGLLVLEKTNDLT